MATIAFVMEHEEGHLLPTFSLARRLAERGHAVHYLSLADGEDFIRAHGFAFTPVLERVFPRGSMRMLRQTRGTVDAGRLESGEALDERYFGALVRGQGFDEVVRALRPDLFIATSFHGANALVLHYRYGRPIVQLTPFLRPTRRAEYAAGVGNALSRLGSGLDEFFSLVRLRSPGARRLADIAAPLLRMRELVLCPEDLEIPRQDAARDPEVFYVEASIDLERREEGAFPWQRLDPSRKLLYCAFGSQSHLYGRERIASFLRRLAGALESHPDWQVVAATGGLLGPEDLPDLPSGFVLAGWAPQLALLRRSAVAITHGGLGSLKECIFHGVPMLVFPLVNDQPANAERVAHHGLGLRGDLDAMTAEGLAALLREVDENPTFRTGVGWMRGAIPGGRGVGGGSAADRGSAGPAAERTGEPGTYELMMRDRTPNPRSLTIRSWRAARCWRYLGSVLPGCHSSGLGRLAASAAACSPVRLRTEVPK